VRVLFLDIDGVLNSQRTAVAFNGCPFDVRPESLHKWDMAAVNLLRGLCMAGNIKIVLSSTWRLDPDYLNIGTALNLPLIDRTGTAPWMPADNARRGREIKAWLDDHVEVTHYAIVDDDSDMLPEQTPYFVQTSNFDGLTWAPFVKLCGIFGVNEYDCCPARQSSLAMDAAPATGSADGCEAAKPVASNGSNETKGAQ
jgi:hypothetical protein